MTATDLKGEDLFPIELAPDLLWMGSCLEVPYRGTMLHSYTSSYMVSGSESSLLIDPGITGDPHMLERQLETALAPRRVDPTYDVVFDDGARLAVTVAGPDDGPARCQQILRTLEDHCGSDGFHFIVPGYAMPQ